MTIRSATIGYVDNWMHCKLSVRLLGVWTIVCVTPAKFTSDDLIIIPILVMLQAYIQYILSYYGTTNTNIIFYAAKNCNNQQADQF